jgi:hypothetical protein
MTMNAIRLLALTLLVAVGCSTPSGSPAPPAPTTDASSAAAATPRHASSVRAHRARPRPATPRVPRLDLRTPQQIAQAACAGNACRGTAVKPMLAAATATPILPASWTVPNWYRDIAKSVPCASDTNSGTSATCVGGCSGTVCPSGIGPVVHYQEIAVHRWGTYSPRLQQNTVITALSSDTDASDPIYWNPYLENGGYASLTAALPPPVCTTTLSARTAKNRGTGQLLNVTFTACPGAAPNAYVINTTHPSHAFIYTAGAGASWNMSQPQAPMTVPFATDGVEVDTWAPTDAVSVYNLLQVNLVSILPLQSSYDLAFDNFAYLSQLSIFDPGGVSSDDVFIGGNTNGLDFTSQRDIVIDPNNFDSNGFGVFFVDFDNQGFVETSAFPAIFQQEGGVIKGDIIQFVSNDSIIASSGTLRNATVELAYIAAGVTLHAGLTSILIAAPGPVGPFVWGPGTLDSEDAGTLQYPTGAAVATFLQSGGMKLQGQANACSYTVASPSVINCGISITPAHLDAAAGAAGFGGVAFLPGGAAYTTYGF